MRRRATRTGSRRLAGTATVVAAVAAVSAVGSARPAASSPRLLGNPTAGKSTFVSTCGACHTLAAAGAAGTIGPDLDKVSLSEAQIIKAIANGGASIMTKAALAKYPTKMVAYKGTLTSKQIQNVAAYVYTSSKATASKSNHTGAAAAEPGVTLTLAAPSHTPRIKTRWKYTVLLTVDGKAAKGKVTAEIVDPTGKAHPVQYGTSKKNVARRPFKGSFSSFVVWPASSRHVPLTFRISVVTGNAANAVNAVVSYRVRPK